LKTLLKNMLKSLDDWLNPSVGKCPKCGGKLVEVSSCNMGSLVACSKCDWDPRWQELEVAIDVPVGTTVEMLPLLLSSEDMTLLSALMKRFKIELFQEKLTIFYKSSQRIYYEYNNTFKLGNQTFHPEKLRVAHSW